MQRAISEIVQLIRDIAENPSLPQEDIECTIEDILEEFRARIWEDC